MIKDNDRQKCTYNNFNINPAYYIDIKKYKNIVHNDLSNHRNVKETEHSHTNNKQKNNFEINNFDKYLNDINLNKNGVVTNLNKINNKENKIQNSKHIKTNINEYNMQGDENDSVTKKTDKNGFHNYTLINTLTKKSTWTSVSS